MKSKGKTIRVLVGTRHPAVPAALGGLNGRVSIEAVEAVSTEGVYNGLPGCALVIVDLDDLVPSPGVSTQMLSRTLEQSEVPVVSGADFAAGASSWIARASAASGLLDALPAQVILITGYSGGVGKTTLSLNLARYVSTVLRLPAAVIEIGFGAGALRALTEPALPDWYDVLTQGCEVGEWNGVTLLPMDYASARLLLSRESEILDLVRRIASTHVLTVLDAAGANPIRSIVMPLVAERLIVAEPRPDALLNAGAMLRDLSDAQIVLNKVGSVGDQLALFGVKAACRLPASGRPLDDPRLAEGLLQVVYPGWKSQTGVANTFKKGK